MTHPYRPAPPRPVVAPRAAWWRRLWHRDVADRLEIRRLRLIGLAEAPWSATRSGWRMRAAFAREIVNWVNAHPPMHVHAAAVMAYKMRAVTNRRATAEAFAEEEATSWATT